MSRLFRLRKNEKGQSMVEFALILPVLILIVAGIVDFGWLFWGKMTLTSAAREGARVYAVLNDTTKATAAINATNDLSKLIIGTPGFSNIDGGATDVDKVKIELEGTMEPLFGLFIKDDVTMKATAVMRQEVK